MISRLVLILSLFIVPAAHAAAAEAPIVNGKQALFQLSYPDAESVIGAALADKGAGAKVAATMNGNRMQPVFSYTTPVTAEIHRLTVNKDIRQWSASLYVMNGTQVVTAIPVAGRYEEVAEIPVLKREVRAGELISQNDIEVRDFPLSRTRSDTVRDMSALIGKTPMFTISRARPIRETEISRPAVIKKNAMVEMRFTSPGMEISTSGQAMTDGAQGDVIGVRNLASKRVITAVVQDEKTVTITTPTTQVSQNGASYETH